MTTSSVNYQWHQQRNVLESCLNTQLQRAIFICSLIQCFALQDVKTKSFRGTIQLGFLCSQAEFGFHQGNWKPKWKIFLPSRSENPAWLQLSSPRFHHPCFSMLLTWAGGVGCFYYHIGNLENLEDTEREKASFMSVRQWCYNVTVVVMQKCAFVIISKQ